MGYIDLTGELINQRREWTYIVQGKWRSKLLRSTQQNPAGDAQCKHNCEVNLPPLIMNFTDYKIFENYNRL